MILITPLPGISTTKPGSASRPFPGVDAAVYNEAGDDVGPGGGGYLVLRRPWPSMLRGIYGDDERYRETYWSKYPDTYFAGDGARIDSDGDFWLLGRVDDVMNVSGHRISTIEVESALVDHHDVAEAAVAARNDALTGQAIVAFVTLKAGIEGTVEKLEELRDHVAVKIGPIAKPANIVFTPELPKTRSGKIMRRLLRDVAENRPLGDTTTLADPAVVDELRTRSSTRTTMRLELAAACRRARLPAAIAPDDVSRRSPSGRERLGGAGHRDDPERLPRLADAGGHLEQRRALVGHMPTQVLYGERVVVLERQGAWTKIAVPDQPSPLDPRGYPGLGPELAAAARRGPRRTVTVTVPQAKLSTGAEVELRHAAAGGRRSGELARRARRRRARRRACPPRRRSRSRARAPTSSAARSSSSACAYLWGGLSAWGYDCSGLTWAVYRAHGITIPRDADAQFTAGRAVSLEDAKPGDLIFYGTSFVHHVTMYLGNGHDDRGAELGERGAHRPDPHRRLRRRAHVPRAVASKGVTVKVVIIPPSRCSAMWQCSIHTPGLSTLSRMSHVCPAGTRTVSFQTRFGSTAPSRLRIRKRPAPWMCSGWCIGWSESISFTSRSLTWSPTRNCQSIA